MPDPDLEIRGGGGGGGGRRRSFRPCDKGGGGWGEAVSKKVFRPFGPQLVCFTTVFSVVTQRSSCGEESCVTTLKTAVYQTRLHFGLKIIGGGAGAPLLNPPLRI